GARRPGRAGPGAVVDDPDLLGVLGPDVVRGPGLAVAVAAVPRGAGRGWRVGRCGGPGGGDLSDAGAADRGGDLPRVQRPGRGVRLVDGATPLRSRRLAVGIPDWPGAGPADPRDPPGPPRARGVAGGRRRPAAIGQRGGDGEPRRAAGRPPVARAGL